MKELQFAQSVLFQQSQNEFMAQYLQYQTCPFCSRKFFRGKLAYHLKLCNNDHPMLKNAGHKTKRSHIQNSQSTFDTNYQRCTNCNAKIPKFLMERHCKNCSVDQYTKQNVREIDIKKIEKKRNDVNFPRIQNSARENIERKANITNEIKKPLSSVKIREDLRCMRKAEEVQKVVCDNCGRKFSEKAALRHIPICQKLKKKQQISLSLQKQSKSLFSRTKRKSNDCIEKGVERGPSRSFEQKERVSPSKQFFHEQINQIKEMDIEQSMDYRESEENQQNLQNP